MTSMIQVLQIQNKINEALISKEMSLCKDHLLLKDFYLFSFFFVTGSTFISFNESTLKAVHVASSTPLKEQHPQSSVSAASPLPPATFQHHMIHPVLQKLGERSQHSAAYMPRKTGNTVLTNRPVPPSTVKCGNKGATENIAFAVDVV